MLRCQLYMSFCKGVITLKISSFSLQQIKFHHALLGFDNKMKTEWIYIDTQIYCYIMRIVTNESSSCFPKINQHPHDVQCLSLIARVPSLNRRAVLTTSCILSSFGYLHEEFGQHHWNIQSYCPLNLKEDDNLLICWPKTGKP